MVYLIARTLRHLYCSLTAFMYHGKRDLISGFCKKFGLKPSVVLSNTWPE